MNIASLCQREVVGIDVNASVREAATLMCEEHVGALVVMAGEDPPKVVGFITDRDLVIDVLARSGDPADLKVGHLAKAPPLAIQGTATVADAAAAMEEAGVRRLLVVDPDGGVIGLVSSDDMLSAVADDLGTLSRVLRANIKREKSERKVMRTAPAVRPFFPAFGTAAVQ
jgi:CBS domain-containing protein